MPLPQNGVEIGEWLFRDGCLGELSRGLQFLNAIARSNEHVPGFREVRFVAERAVPRNDLGVIVGERENFVGGGSLRAIPTADQVQMLETGWLDVGFLRLPIGGHSALDVVAVHCERFVLVVPASHKLAKRKRVRLSEVSGEDFVMYERTYAPGFHDLIFGMLRDARIVPNVSQTGAEISTLISLVDADMGIAILSASAVSHSVASVIACDIVDQIPMSEIAIGVSVDNFRTFALKNLGRARNS